MGTVNTLTLRPIKSESYKACLPHGNSQLLCSTDNIEHMQPGGKEQSLTDLGWLFIFLHSPALYMHLDHFVTCLDDIGTCDDIGIPASPSIAV